MFSALHDLVLVGKIAVRQEQQICNTVFNLEFSEEKSLKELKSKKNKKIRKRKRLKKTIGKCNQE